MLDKSLYKYWLNTGSVGFPIDKDYRACCLIYNDEDSSVEFHRIEYDSEKTMFKIKNNKFLPDFITSYFLKSLENNN